MKNTLIKDTFREIRKTFGRFISILGIALVGVAFFSGVKASAPYMKKSADAYFDRENLFDFKIYSPTGFSEADIDKISGIEGVRAATGAYANNAVATIDTTKKVFQLMSYNLNSMENDDSYINRLSLVEGRLPEKSGECVIRYHSMKDAEISVGDTITLEDANTKLSRNDFTVVGKVSTPYYLSYQYDSSNVGDGKVEYVISIPTEDFALPVYNVVYATVLGADSLDTYSDEYFETTDPVKKRIEDAGNWYVYDRESHFSYIDYKSCADRMDAIAKVFPVFFYLVAALVCLTTMTRMVDEQRQNIGTLKALGYNKARIAMKYIVYAAAASLTGGIAGCIIGLNIFPRIIFTAWNTVYTVDKLVAVPQTALCIIAVSVAIAVTIFAVIVACIGELVEVPAMLLRPKAPKNGKKILLEHISILWRHMSFSGKVTARNIFRYKKRFFMTVIGIAGCTALILAGFGIKNSVSTVVNDQYGNIFSYDIAGKFNSDSDKASFSEYCQRAKAIESFYINTQLMGKADTKEPVNDSTAKSVTLISVDDADTYADFATLDDHSSGEALTIPSDGALISYKMAKDFHLEKGDSFYIDVADKTVSIKVSGIITMYVGQYVFMQDSYYTECFDEAPSKNNFIARLTGDSLSEHQKFGSEIMQKYKLESISYFAGIKENFGDMIASLDIITLVLIVSAALLAFVVLYNLINVNISERIREIATIKVLGFYDNEVQQYVYRENIILTIIGSFLGLLLGILLHGYIMKVIEMDDVIFPRKIFWYSYLISVIITIIFGFLVNLFMNKKLKKIPMVESLKSVE